MSDSDALWQIVYTGALFCVEKHRTKGWERAVRPPGVRLLLKDTHGNILLTKEYRSELGTHDIRLPGGKVFDELAPFLKIRDDEVALQEAVFAAARLEARQEAGILEIADMQLFSKSTLGASVVWDLYYVTGTITAQGAQELEVDEKERGIAVHFFSPEETVRLLNDGHIQEERSIVALQSFLKKK